MASSSFSSSFLFLLVVLLSCSSSAWAHLGCPSADGPSPEEADAQLRLEDYFVGHKNSYLPLTFFEPADEFLDNTAGKLGLQSNQFRYERNNEEEKNGKITCVSN